MTGYRGLPRCVLRGFDLLATLAAQDADEPAHRVLLPAGGLHDLGQGGSALPLEIPECSALIELAQHPLGHIRVQILQSAG